MGISMKDVMLSSGVITEKDVERVHRKEVIEQEKKRARHQAALDRILGPLKKELENACGTEVVASYYEPSWSLNRCLRGILRSAYFFNSPLGDKVQEIIDRKNASPKGAPQKKPQKKRPTRKKNTKSKTKRQETN